MEVAADFVNGYEVQYVGKYTIWKVVFMSPYLCSLPGNEIIICTILDTLEALGNLSGHRRLANMTQIEAAAPRISVEEPSKIAVVTGWDSLPYDLQENIFQRVEFEDLFRVRISCKSWKKLIDSEDFSKLRGTSSREGSFTAINYYIKNKEW